MQYIKQTHAPHLHRQTVDYRRIIFGVFLGTSQEALKGYSPLCRSKVI